MARNDFCRSLLLNKENGGLFLPPFSGCPHELGPLPFLPPCLQVQCPLYPCFSTPFGAQVKNDPFFFSIGTHDQSYSLPFLSCCRLLYSPVPRRSMSSVLRRIFLVLQYWHARCRDLLFHPMISHKDSFPFFTVGKRAMQFSSVSLSFEKVVGSLPFSARIAILFF